MNEAEQELEEKLAEVRRGYVARLPGRMQEVYELLDAVRAGDEEATSSLHRQIHSLTGSLGTFGYQELSLLARIIERKLKAVVHQEITLDATLLAEIESEIAQLEAGTRTLQAGHDEAAQTSGAQPGKAPLIFVLDHEQASGEALAGQIGSFGYDTRAFTRLDGLVQAMVSARPQVILMRLATSDPAHLEQIDMLDTIRSEGEHSTPPVIFIGDRGDLETRLAAVRAGAVGFFTMPVDINALMDRMDTITLKAHAVPYRVLIVDDDSDLGSHYTLLLRKVGIEARHLTNPMELLTVIDEFKPELILMDLYMPECTGIELAKVVRQNNAYLGIPIIFLSSETSMSMQFHALSQGGDGFITKPISDEDLINSVLVRSERTRAVSSHLAKDSLTGLLNHSTSKDMVGTEFQRALRSGNPLSCVMLDLDHFKQVNDSHGHMMGDHVIATLSRVLQQRLRETDIIGRYGGEEFIVLMPNTPADAAYRVIDELRRRFAQLVHHAETQDFTVTLSAGISESTYFDDADQMINAADEALYRAKSGGRDQVRVAVGPQDHSSMG
jgi:diguanylate cyclase (GGDEF)-like protein